MNGSKLYPLLFGGLLLGAILSVVDLRSAEAHHVVIYTTPALRELLEKDILPRFKARHGIDTSVLYVAAGQQYNRLRMSSDNPEVDVFLHAAPLYLEKGYAQGHFEAYEIPQGDNVSASFKSRPVEGGHIWYAFAWTPLVEVYSPAKFREPPDLNRTDLEFGLAHPLLSNNGVYNAVFFEHDARAREVGAQAVAQTRVQPVNARASISGVAEGHYDLTLGYEAATLFFLNQGAQAAYALPRLDGREVATPVLFSAGLVEGHRHQGAEAFLRFLFENETQEALAKYHFRPVREGFPEPAEGLKDLPPLSQQNHYDWSRWEALERALPRYEVKA